MTHPTDPYRDNPAHREIADLQRRLKVATAAVTEWREDSAEAWRRVVVAERETDAVRSATRMPLLRLATCGVLSTGSGAFCGYVVGDNTAGSVAWLLGVFGVVLAVSSAVALHAAVWTEPPP